MASPPLPAREMPSLINTSHFEDESFEVNEDTIQSYESPRPMGPKELPMDHSYMSSEAPYDYNFNATESAVLTSTADDAFLVTPETQSTIPTTSSYSPLSNQSSQSRRKSFPKRRYQNLLLGGESPFISHDTDNTKPEQESLSSLLIPPRPNGSVAGNDPIPSPPYPLDYSLMFDLDDNQSIYDPITEQKNNTPTHIPTLVGNNLLPVSPTRGEFFGNLQYQTSVSQGSPSIETKSPLFDSRYALYDLKQTPTSPSQRGSSQYPTSRSPSPTKTQDRTSWYIRDSVYPVDMSYDEANESPEERIPRWSLLEAENSDYFDELEPFTPISNKFDYSILPELPSLGESQPYPYNDVMRPIARPDILPRSSTLNSKKHESLPPIPLDLPRLPFSSSSLNAQHFATCTAVWSLSEIYGWCLKLKSWLHDSPISHEELRKALIKLVIFHKRSLPIDIINRNVTRILESLYLSNAITKATSLDLEQQESTEPVSIQFDDLAKVNAVYPELTACYSYFKDHQQEEKSDKLLCCYSSRCEINRWIEQKHKLETTKIEDIQLGADWASHWKLAANDIIFDPVVTKRQSFLFDLIKFEQKFIQRADCFVKVVGPDFIKVATTVAGASLVTSAKKFKEDILVPANELLEVHKSVLMEPLLKLLLAEGRIISDVVSIAQYYTAWSKASTNGLLRYMSVVPMIEDIMHSDVLKLWAESLGRNAMVKDLKVNGSILLLSTFNSRYQQLPLQLSDIRKTFSDKDVEFTELTRAIDNIKKLGNKVNAMKVHADNIHALRRIEKQLAWKSSVVQPNLNLQSKLRKFFFRGNLTRKGDLKIKAHAVHVIILDNYILLTERLKGARAASYKVVENPIPIDFVILETRERETGTLAAMTTPILNSTQTNSKAADHDDSDVSTFPFKIRYAGRGKSQAYTFYATSEKERESWFTGVLQARANLLKRVSPLAPYKVEGIECAFFAYDFNDRMLKLPICASNDPLKVISEETNILLKQRGVKTDLYSAANIPNSLVMGRVRCSEKFTYRGIDFHLVGLSAGLYCSDLKNRWKRMLNATNVTKITVLPAFNVILVLANKLLKYYSLPQFVDVYFEKKETISSTMLSNDQIQFYEVGRHREVPTLFLAKKKNAGVTNFKVFTIETDNNGIMSSFALIKRFYIQAECYGLSVFNTTIAVHTQRGFEILDLQRLQPRTVPEIPMQDASSKKIDIYTRKANTQGSELIRKALLHNGIKPMGMFKLNNNKEFLLVYNEGAIFVNKSGKLSRNTMIKFDFKPKSAAFQDNELFIVNEEVIEVWSISDQSKGTNMLHQVISGKDIAATNCTNLCFVAANPRKVGLQMVFYILPSLRAIKSVS